MSIGDTVDARAVATPGHEPRRLTPADLQALPKPRPTRPKREPVQDFDFPVRPPRQRATSATVEWPAESSVVPTTSPIFHLPGWLVGASLGALDPQIAVGHSHVIITTTSTIAFYTRGGSQLKVIGADAFFAPLKSDINAHLNIPSDLVEKYSINEFYDVRVLYDRYRDRLWLGGFVRNVAAKYGNAVDQTFRRTKFVLAVSDNGDPQGAWTLWWWDAIVDDGAQAWREICAYIGAFR
jgi:hypothetical protein